MLIAFDSAPTVELAIVFKLANPAVPLSRKNHRLIVFHKFIQLFS
jgi:hypothetical protein